jgi:hypothetical protein
LKNHPVWEDDYGRIHLLWVSPSRNHRSWDGHLKNRPLFGDRDGSLFPRFRLQRRGGKVLKNVFLYPGTAFPVIARSKYRFSSLGSSAVAASF